MGSPATPLDRLPGSLRRQSALLSAGPPGDLALARSAGVAANVRSRASDQRRASCRALAVDVLSDRSNVLSGHSPRAAGPDSPVSAGHDRRANLLDAPEHDSRSQAVTAHGRILGGIRRSLP